MECIVHTFIFPYVPQSPHMKAHEESDIAKKKKGNLDFTLNCLTSVYQAPLGNSPSTIVLPDHEEGFHKFSSAESSDKTYFELKAYAISQLIDW